MRSGTAGWRTRTRPGAVPPAVTTSGEATPRTSTGGTDRDRRGGRRASTASATVAATMAAPSVNDSSIGSASASSATTSERVRRARGRAHRGTGTAASVLAIASSAV